MVEEVLTRGAVAEALRVAQRFADRVGRNSAVARVVALRLPDGLSIWTLLDGDPSGQARKAVYNAEFAIRSRNPLAPLEFRVIDAAEFPPESRSSLLPTDVMLLYEQDGAHRGPNGHSPHAR